MNGHAESVFATNVIAVLGAEPAKMPVLQVGGHSSLSPCACCTHRGTGWAWREMETDVGYSWGIGRPGIG